jgi:hypothetical protein
LRQKNGRNFGRWCSGSARLSEAQQVLVQSQVSRPLEATRENFGPIVHGDLENSFIGRRGSNPLSGQLENSVSHNLSKAVLGNGPIGRPAAFEAVHRVGSIPTSPAKASEPKHHGYLSIGAETCGAKARDVAGSNPALRWPRREHHLLEA